ncbi:hypothetical protein IKG12_03055 [Candidatus Saccharibacteria bacterium]|nr:hypothetical protein [Candidatus Saccharibacteria bacterium]
MAKKLLRRKTATADKQTVNFMNIIFTVIVGAIALGAGLFGIFTDIKDISTLALIAGNVILAIAVVEFINMLRTGHKGSEFVFSLMRAGTGVLIAVLLIINYNQNMTWPLVLLSIYAIGRGILDVLTALLFKKDKTEKTMWIFCGGAGCILGIITLNAGGFADKTAFFRIFCTYLAAYGITALISSTYVLKAKK